MAIKKWRDFAINSAFRYSSCDVKVKGRHKYDFDKNV